MYRLRERTAELERELAEGRHNAERSLRARARSTLSAVLIVLGVICVSTAPVAVWGRNLVLDTDHYVQTLEPVGRDSGVQAAVIRLVDQQIDMHLDVTNLVKQALPGRAGPLLGPVLQSAIVGLVNTITTRFVQSPAFVQLWVLVNRVAHQQVVYVLTGERPENAGVSITSGNKVILDLAPIVSTVKQQLVNAGLSIASSIPTVGATLEIAELRGVNHAQRLVRLLDTVADWLPLLALGLFTGGVWTARQRRRALMRTGLAAGFGLVVVELGLLLAREHFLDQIPAEQLPRGAAAAVFETVVRYLRLSLRVSLVVALLIALGAWLSGPTRSATGIRRWIVTGPRALVRRLDAGPVGAFVTRNVTALRIAVIAAVFVILALTTAPSFGTVLALAVVCIVVLSALEILRVGTRRVSQGEVPFDAEHDGPTTLSS